jgi:hypothetical protein
LSTILHFAFGTSLRQRLKPVANSIKGPRRRNWIATGLSLLAGIGLLIWSRNRK